ncbi:response regulator [Zavarzinella formosa]|uniref:response regulator n=1 Tax=Zavarzinella formosa TaxID=360055 RepID=UPI0003169295|nr:response regulator [Zavarzinella formosa]
MPKILIVEDNEENRDALSRRLQRRGFQVVMAFDGKLGIEAAKTEMPDLILMDMNMPEIDGWQATKQLKTDPETAHIPVIALTAHAMGGDRERAIEAGCVDYHPKPVELPKLLTQIETILTLKQGTGGASPADAVAGQKAQVVREDDAKKRVIPITTVGNGA